MFSTVKDAFKVKEIRGKIFFTLFVLFVYRLGSYITVPGVNAGALQSLANSGLASILNTFSGGGLSNYSLFAMGVSPYITAQIVVQLLQMDIVPKFVEWSKQGEVVQLWNDQIAGESGSALWEGIGFVAVVVIALLIIVQFVTWVQQAERRLRIQYTRRTTTAPANSYLPLKINVSGVIPVIFAGAFISTPQTILVAFQQAHSGDTWYQILTSIFNLIHCFDCCIYIFLRLCAS